MTSDLVAAPAAPLDLALLKAVGLDRAAPEQRQLAISIAERYGLDLLLKHLVLIEGRPYITRDALLHIAHRSGQFDGIAVSRPILDGEFWTAECTVYRKDMTHPFVYSGRYPAKGGNAKFAPEMATKVAECMALRRAFDVAAPVFEERWDAEVAVEPAPQPKTAREIVAEKAERLLAEPMAPEVSAVVEPRPGMNAAALAALARDAGKTKGQIAQAIAMVRPGMAVPGPAEVSDIVRAMSPEELRLLAVELNLDGAA